MPILSINAATPFIQLSLGVVSYSQVLSEMLRKMRAKKYYTYSVVMIVELFKIRCLYRNIIKVARAL